MLLTVSFHAKENFVSSKLSHELKQADTAFFCGTAAEVIGWESLDETKFSLAWNETVSSKIQSAYKNLVIEKAIEVNKEANIEKQFA